MFWMDVHEDWGDIDDIPFSQPISQPISEPITDTAWKKKRTTRDLVMTASKVGEENVVRLERHNKRHVDMSSVHYVAEGPYKGIIINKAARRLNDVEKPSVSMSFTACLEGSAAPSKEIREIRFWFKQQSDPKHRRSSAQEYFKELLQPEAFPKDYANFIKKAVVLCQQFPLLKRIELSLRPAPPGTPEAAHYEGEEQVEQIIAPKKSSFTTYSSKSSTTTTTTTTTTKTVRGRGGRPGEEEEEEEEEYTDEQLENMIKNYITVMTPAVYDYQFLPEVPVSKKRWVTFKVKAKCDAHIALSSVYGDTNRKTYEIVIGGGDNSKTIVRDGGQGRVLEEVVTLNALDQDDSRSFWISWAKQSIEVGEGYFRGENLILRCRIPQNKVHSVNCMSVSTGPQSEGEWEFVEYLSPTDEAATRDGRRQQIRMAIMWAAKKQRMLETLEDSYPNSVDTSTLLRAANIRMSNMMQAVVFLKDLQKRELITEVTKGVWMRAPASKQGDQHDVHIVDELPTLSRADSPSLAVVTAMYCEKLAVDAMMDNKVTYVSYKKDKQGQAESNVYTLGNMGSQKIVSVKLPKVGASRSATIAAGNTVTRLLGIFRDVEHIFLCGVGGAVPSFRDLSKHIRLGNVVVSAPNQINGPCYIHCDKAEPKPDDTYNFTMRTWKSDQNVLVRTIEQLRRMQGNMTSLPWQRYIDEGLETLQAEESDFHRPPTKTDRLYGLVDGKVVEIHHPEGSKPAVEGKTSVFYGPIGSSKYVARNIKLRLDFAGATGVCAYDNEYDSVLEAIRGSRKESFVLIRGIADYMDGTATRGWAPYASLCAAGYLKALVTALPTARRSSGYRY